MIVKDGDQSVVVEEANREQYMVVFPVDYVFDATSLNSTAYRNTFKDETLPAGSWVPTGDATQSRVSKVWKTQESFKRPFSGNSDTFSFKDGEWLNVRMGTKGFSGSAYYAWRS